MIRCQLLMHSHGGGAEQLALLLARELDRRRFAIAVACLRHVPELAGAVPEGVPLLMPDAPGVGAVLRNLVRIRKDCADSDVVVGTLELQSLLAAALLAPPGNAVGWLHKDVAGYLSRRGKAYGRLYTALLGVAAARSRRVVCVSAGVRASAARLLPGCADALRVLPNPVDIDRVRRGAEEPLPEGLAPHFRGPVLLGVGRLVQQKAFHVLIAAHALLRQRGGRQMLCIAGEGPERPFLEAEARRLGVADTTLLPGFLNPWPLMRHARVLGASSIFEGAPLVLVEALALGLPVVSTDCPSGPAEVLGGGAFGTLVPVGDPVALADALQPLLDDAPGPDAANVAACSAARVASGRARAEDFSIARTVGAWEALLEECAAAARK